MYLDQFVTKCLIFWTSSLLDVLGDREKANICSLPRPAQLCDKGKGKADAMCKKIARAVGGTSDVRCHRKNTCAFQVNVPVQHPSYPGN